MLKATPTQGLLNNHFVNPPTNLPIDWNPPKTTASDFNVPRSIHYIWVGENRISDSALRNIYRMARVNCSKSFNSFKITLWTDNTKRILDSMQNAETSDDLILSELARNNNKDSKITVKHYSALFKCAENKDIADHNVKLYLEGLVTRNLYGPFRNYACASDILRLFAVNLGGIYLDVDVAVIDKIPESCLTSKHGIKIYYQDGYLQNNCIISAPNDWVIKNVLMLMCKQHEHEDIDTRYGDRRSSTDEELNVTWHQHRSLQTHINTDGKKANIRKETTINLTGPGLYDTAYLYIYKNYRKMQLQKNAELVKVYTSMIQSRDSKPLTSSDKAFLSGVRSRLASKKLIKEEDFYTARYWTESKVFNNYEDPNEYAKSPEAHKPFFAHGVVFGVAPHGDMKDKLDSWCTVDTKHHDTSDIPCV